MLQGADLFLDNFDYNAGTRCLAIFVENSTPVIKLHSQAQRGVMFCMLVYPSLPFPLPALSVAWALPSFPVLVSPPLSPAVKATLRAQEQLSCATGRREFLLLAARPTFFICRIGLRLLNPIPDTATSAVALFGLVRVRGAKVDLSRGRMAERRAAVRLIGMCCSCDARACWGIALVLCNRNSAAHENLWSYDDWAHHLAALAHMYVLCLACCVHAPD